MTDVDTLSSLPYEDTLDWHLANAPPWLGPESQNPHIHAEKRENFRTQLQQVLQRAEDPPHVDPPHADLPEYQPRENLPGDKSGIQLPPAQQHYSQFKKFMFQLSKFSDDTQVATDAELANAGKIPPSSLAIENAAYDSKDPIS